MILNNSWKPEDGFDEIEMENVGKYDKYKSLNDQYDLLEN